MPTDLPVEGFRGVLIDREVLVGILIDREVFPGILPEIEIPRRGFMTEGDFLTGEDSMSEGDCMTEGDLPGLERLIGDFMTTEAISEVTLVSDSFPG